MITSCVHWQEAKKGEREENVLTKHQAKPNLVRHYNESHSKEDLNNLFNLSDIY